MAPRRIKNFSPYSYSIQYAKAGEGPNQKPRPYVNMALLPEEHYVVSKQEPNWFVYVHNSAIYSLNDDCSLSLDNVAAEITIINKSNLKDAKESTLIELREDPMKSTVINLKKGLTGFVWVSSNCVELFHLFDGKADCVIIADGKYLSISKQMTSDDKLMIWFDDNFIKLDYNEIIAIVYKIDDPTFPLKTLTKDDVNVDDINHCIYFDNPFLTNKCVPLIYNKGSRSYKVGNIDLTPNRVIISNDDLSYLNKSDIEAELENVNAQIDEIIADHPYVPSAALLEMNAEFANLVNQSSILNEKLDFLGDTDEYFDISSIMLYTFNSDCFSCSVRYGVNSKYVNWVGSSVVIDHNLKGYVNVVIDDTLHSQTSYKIFELSENRVKIQFDRPEYAVCSVRIFKIGDR